MPLIIGANSISGYEIDNSLRFNSGSSDYLNRNSNDNTDPTKVTRSFWTKRASITGVQRISTAMTSGFAKYHYIRFEDGILKISDSSGTSYALTQQFRDVSAWYHIVVSIDTTLATSADRVKVYVNGSQVTAFTSSTAPTQNSGIFIGQTSNGPFVIGALYGVGYGITSGSPQEFYSGYVSEYYLIDGQALAPSDFGEFDSDSGIWKPIAYTGTYGTKGFYLEFKDSSALGDDTSGNSNDFTVNNLTSIDQTTDTPTNNFCTMNPLLTNDISTFSEGNCKLTTGTGASTSGMSFAMTQGKWFAEFTCTAKTSVNMLVGLVRVDTFDGDNQINEGNNIGYGYFNGTGNVLYPSGDPGDVYGASWAVNDIMGIAFDADTRNVTFYKNGVSQGVYTRIASDNTGGDWVMAVCEGQGAATATFECNFGNPVSTISSGNSDANGYGNFEHAVPSGYYALCTKNLAEYG